MWVVTREVTLTRGEARVRPSIRPQFAYSFARPGWGIERPALAALGHTVA